MTDTLSAEKDRGSRARILYMMWEDTEALGRLMRASRMDEAEFVASPMSRDAVFRVLVPLVGRTESLGPEGRASVAGMRASDWDALLAAEAVGCTGGGHGASDDGPLGLGDPALPHRMGPDAAKRLWRETLPQVPRLRLAIANDVRVIRERARLARVMTRGADEWPQPGRVAAVAREAEGNRTWQRLSQAAGVVAEAFAACDHAMGSDGTGGTAEAGGRPWPIRRMWLVMGEPSPVVMVEDEPGMSDEIAARLARAMGDACGQEVTLVPQAQVHPAIWDDTVAREALLWEREGATHEPVVPAAAMHAHGCGHDHGHGHEHH